MYDGGSILLSQIHTSTWLSIIHLQHRLVGKASGIYFLNIGFKKDKKFDFGVLIFFQLSPGPALYSVEQADLPAKII